MLTISSHSSVNHHTDLFGTGNQVKSTKVHTTVGFVLDMY